jgi:hypothetical protein
MISLANLPPLGQAGVNRLHSTLRRIRREVEDAGVSTPPDTNVRSHSVDLLAPQLRKSVPSLIPGLTWNEMFSRNTFLSYSFPDADNRPCVFPAAQGFQSLSLPCRFIVTGTCHGALRNSVRSGVSIARGADSLTQTKKLPAPNRALRETCFTCVACQPQPPVVQALQKV